MEGQHDCLHLKWQFSDGSILLGMTPAISDYRIIIYIIIKQLNFADVGAMIKELQQSKLWLHYSEYKRWIKVQHANIVFFFLNEHFMWKSFTDIFYIYKSATF